VFCAGAVGGFTTSFLTGPIELIKCIAQTNVQNEGNMREEWGIFRSLVVKHGWLGAYGPFRGLCTTICREVPALGLYFTIYEGICRQFEKSNAVSFFAGGTAGAISWAMIYPVDVMKTRWQIAAPGQYRSFRHCWQEIGAREGWRAFAKGFWATMCRSWPQNAVIFCTYETMKDMIG